MQGEGERLAEAGTVLATDVAWRALTASAHYTLESAILYLSLERLALTAEVSTSPICLAQADWSECAETWWGTFWIVPLSSADNSRVSHSSHLPERISLNPSAHCEERHDLLKQQVPSSEHLVQTWY